METDTNMSDPTIDSNIAASQAKSQPSPQGQHTLTASQQEALRRVTKIIDSFVLRNDCAPFLEPVDWRGLELYDYPTIIKKPMDLGTIKRKLERNQYKSAAYCVADVRRVWNNCMTYNTVGSDFYILAKNCSKRFEDRYRRIRNECTYISIRNTIATVLAKTQIISQSRLYKSILTHTAYMLNSVFPLEDDIGEEPPKSDVEDNNDERMNERGRGDSVVSRRRGQDQGGDEEEDGDEENEFQGNDDDDEMDEEEDDDDDQDEEVEAKTSDASGSPANSSNNKNKRQRSNTPPPATYSQPSSSFDVKMQLSTNLLYLNGTDLGHIMSILEQHCPNVLEMYNSENKSLQLPECMEINVDLLMDEYYNVFAMIQQYCNDHMVKRRVATSSTSGNGVKIKDISNKRKERKA